MIARRWSGAFAASLASQAAVGTSRLLLSVVVGRSAGRESLGDLTALLSIATFLVLLWPQGLGATASRRLAAARAREDADDERLTASYVAVASVVAGTLLGLAAAVWATLLEMGPQEAGACAVVTLSLSAYAAVRGIRNGRMQLPQAATWDMVGSLLAIALVWILVARDVTNPAVLVLPTAVPYVVGAIAGWPRIGRRPPAGDRREIRGFTTWTSVQVTASGGMLPVVTLVGALLVSDRELGDLGAAISLATPTILFSIALRTSAAPFVAREMALGNHTIAARLVDRAFKLLTSTLVPAFVLVTFWSHDVMGLVYSTDFEGSYTPLCLLLMGTCLQAINAAPIWFMSTRGGARPLAAGYAAGLVVAVVTAGVATPGLGTTGPALGFVTGSLVSSTLTTALAWRETGLVWGSVISFVALGLATMIVGLVYVAPSDPIVKSVATIAFAGPWSFLTWRFGFYRDGSLRAA